MATKNLGQVAAIWLGTSAPENTSLIWFDTTPAIRKHKVYDEDLADWVVLDNDAISAITYNELQTLAQDPGLTLGSWYRITDPEYANTLALAITSTKIKYVDVNNNLIIDDLAGSKTYVVNSSNLTIDEIAGTWDALQKKLNFPFSRLSGNSDRGDDLVLAERTVSGTTEFAVYTFRSLVSSHSSNSLTWSRNGVFFNFVSALNNVINVNNGVVGYNQYQIDLTNLNQALGDIAQAVASSIEANQQYTDGAIEELDIYARQIPTAPVVPANPETIAVNDSLQTICGKIQYWLIKLAQQSSGILVNENYSYNDAPSSITPGTSTLTDWMEYAEWNEKHKLHYTQIIRAISNFNNVNFLLSQGYQSFLVKKGTYNATSGYDISNLFTVGGEIVFEPGCVINVTAATAFNLFSGGVSNDKNIKGRIIGNGCVINLVSSTPSQFTAFYQCANISGFKFTGDKPLMIRNCYHVSDCCYGATPNVSRNNWFIIDNCQWVKDCIATGIQESAFIQSSRFGNPINNEVAAYNCFMMIFNWIEDQNDVVQCYSDESSTSIGPSAAGGFNHCNP